MKKTLYLLIIFLLACSPAYAFEDSIESYHTDYTELYTTYISSTSATTTVSQVSDTVENNHKLDIKCYSATDATFTSLIVPNISSSQEYFSFLVKGFSVSDGNKVTPRVAIQIRSAADSTVLATIVASNTSLMTNHKYEVIKNGATFDLYINGVLYSSSASSVPGYTGLVYFCVGPQMYKHGLGYQWEDLYVDDLTTGSIIGVPQIFTESNTNISYTWSAQLMRSYSSQYKISLYSLSNTNNTGYITEWNIPQNDNATTAEYGYTYFSRSAYLDENFGLYMLEMTRGDTILADSYFYYDQLSDPQGFPEILFLGESDVNAEIRDEDNNGGEIDGGGSVYLYPDIQADGTYNFTYEILETPYAIKTELTTVYNNTALNSTTINYSGLSTQTYNVSVDGARVGSTNGADTYSYTLTDWSSETNHIISFDLDDSKAGVWGEVKNSETQEGIKSATVSVSGVNFSKTLYTDSTGLFYLTKGIEAGQTYTISVSKTGYSTPPSQTAITTDGSTTRQDFYMDKLSTTGSGLYYAPHDVTFQIYEHWYSGFGLQGVSYSVFNGTESVKTGNTDSKGMFAVEDMQQGTNYTIILQYNGTTYTKYVEPGLTDYIYILNNAGVLHQYANSWLTLSYTENTNNVTIAYESNKTITGASLTAIAGNGTTVYTQTLSTTTGSFTFETGGEGDYTLNFHIQATDGDTASQSWGLSYPKKIPLFPDSYPAWLKNILFSGIIMVFLLAFGKSKNDIACGSVAILTSMGYLFEWFTGSFYFVVLVWIIALGSIFLHYKRTGGVG